MDHRSSQKKMTLRNAGATHDKLTGENGRWGSPGRWLGQGRRKRRIADNMTVCAMQLLARARTITIDVKGTPHKPCMPSCACASPGTVARPPFPAQWRETRGASAEQSGLTLARQTMVVPTVTNMGT